MANNRWHGPSPVVARTTAGGVRGVRAPGGSRAAARARSAVLTVRKPLRLVLAPDRAWTSWIGGLVVRAIGAWQRRIARKRGIPSPLTGVVSPSTIATRMCRSATGVRAGAPGVDRRRSHLVQASRTSSSSLGPTAALTWLWSRSPFLRRLVGIAPTAAVGVRARRPQAAVTFAPASVVRRVFADLYVINPARTQHLSAAGAGPPQTGGARATPR